MLKIRYISGLHEKLELFSQIDPQRQTWLVADLRSKLHLQHHLIEQHEFVEEISVMRASELWQHFVNVLFPDMNVVSSDFVKAMIRSELRNDKEEWKQRPGTVEGAYAFLESFMPLLSHQSGREVTKEWFVRHEQSHWKWSHWFELSRKLWQVFLKKNILTAQWLSGVLINVEEFGDVWQRDITVDLGAHLSSLEVELLLKLSKFLNVTVLVPNAPWTQEFSLLQVYQPLIDQSEGTQALEVSEPEKNHGTREFHKFTTMISEVKHLTAKVREWIDSGIDTEQIAITAPQVESYWPSLRLHFEKEGIPVAKGVVQRCHSIPSIMKWLSHLRILCGELKYSDLQSCYYGPEQNYELPFSDFERLFSIIYGVEDLQRHTLVSESFSLKSPIEKLSSQDFIAWSLKYWPRDYLQKEQIKPLETLCQRIFQEGVSLVELDVVDWLNYVESVAAKTEFEVMPSKENGVKFVQIYSAEYIDCQCLALLGLSDQALRSSGRHGLSLAEAHLFFQNTGFRLPAVDHQQMEFDGRWLLERSYQHLLASFPATDFNGSPQAPSLLWLKEKLKNSDDFEEVQPPMPCRWDEIQEAVTFDEKGDWVLEGESIKNSLSTERGENSLATFEKVKLRRLSASALEEYIKCPFKFAASRLFGLSDLPTLDLDVDHMTKGSLMHALFESLLCDDSKLNFSDDEISHVIEKCRESERVKIADERLWRSLKSKYHQLARRFLDFEKEWRRKFPQTQTVGREQVVNGFLLLSGELVAECPEQEESVPFKGFIDRVDTFEGKRAAVIDYKSSKGQLRQHASWVKQGQLQLALYAQALEKGLTDLPAMEVSSAIYYIAKGCQRNIGFQMKEHSGELYEVGGNRGSSIDQEQKQRLFAEVNAVVRETLEKVLRGEFSPQPQKSEYCDSCRWRTLCRAPHLN